MINNNDPTAVVTGASSGIGQAIARKLTALGVSVSIIGRDLHRLAQVAQSGSVRSYRADLAEPADLDTLIGELRRNLDHLDLLVHAAGAHRMGPVESASLEDLDLQYRTNLRAPYALTQALLPLLTARHGQIVFINSSAGLDAGGNVSGYAASKHAIKAVADALRAEVNARGVRVLSVYPGRTASMMQASIHAQESRPYRPENLIQPADIADAVVGVLQVPRTAEVTDLRIRPMRPPG